MLLRILSMISRPRLTLQATALILLSCWLFFSGLTLVEQIGLLAETSHHDERALASFEQALQPESATFSIDHTTLGDPVVALALASAPFLQQSQAPRPSLPPVRLPSRNLYQVLSVYRI